GIGRPGATVAQPPATELLPALLFGHAQCLRKVARAITEQQLLETLVGKQPMAFGESRRVTFAHLDTQAAVAVANKAVIQALLRILAGGKTVFRIDRRQLFPPCRLPLF